MTVTVVLSTITTMLFDSQYRTVMLLHASNLVTVLFTCPCSTSTHGVSAYGIMTLEWSQCFLCVLVRPTVHLALQTK